METLAPSPRRRAGLGPIRGRFPNPGTADRMRAFAYTPSKAPDVDIRRRDVDLHVVVDALRVAAGRPLNGVSNKDAQ